MLKRFSKYVFQSVAGMVGISVYVLADTFFISVYSGADGLAVLNLILPVFGIIYAIDPDRKSRRNKRTLQYFHTYASASGCFYHRSFPYRASGNPCLVPAAKT